MNPNRNPRYSWAGEVAKQGTPGGDVIAELVQNCDFKGTGDVMSCYETLLKIPTLTCSDIETATSGLPEVFVDAFCADVKEAVNYIDSDKAANSFTDAINWYQGTLAPCAANICQCSTTPLDAAQIAQAPTNLFKRVAESQLKKRDLFFLKYGFAVTIVLAAVIVVLLFVIILKTPEKHINGLY